MTKTLIANLGVPGDARLFPSTLTHLTIDGTAPNDVQVLTLVIDASEAQPAKFLLDRIRVLDGQEFRSEEIHYVSNMSLIIEYEEAQYVR